MKKIKDKELFLLLVLLVILKIIIVSVQPIYVQYTMKYDDQLMVNLANNIINGNWLGDYNSKTLIKGIITPLFVSFTYILHIPFLIGKEILYDLACIFFINIISKKVKSRKILFITFLAILFNPVEYSTELSRVYRDGIYMSLVIFMIGQALGILFTIKEDLKVQRKYLIELGITISAMYLCREENIWIYPFLCFMIASIIIIILLDKKMENKIKRSIQYFIPVIIILININIVCILNYKYYGVYELNQYWGKDFKAAYGALTRVKPEQEIDRVPVTQDTLEKLYELSPKLSELRDFFNGNMGKEWQMCGEHISGEINGGYFHWALMNAVEERGYYKDAKTANQYYKELAKEINDLCDKNIIESRSKKRNSNTCYFTIKDIIEVIQKMPETIKYQINLEKVKMEVTNYLPETPIEEWKENKQIFEKITRQGIRRKTIYENTWNNMRLQIMEYIEKIYQKTNKYIFNISIVAFLIIFIINMRKKEYTEIIILLGLMILYLTRIFLITFTSEEMFKEALNVAYLSNIYSVQYIFSILSILFLAQYIKKLVKKYKIKKECEIWKKK